jgi:hypothetical protein
MKWRSSDPRVAVVNDSGDVTAVGHGSATITASFMSVSGAAQIAVTQIAAQIYPMDGNAQSGPVGWPLPARLVVRVLDSNGVQVAGVPVTFTTSGGGSVENVSPESNALGEASASWILGAEPGTQLLTVGVTGRGTASLVMRATATPRSGTRPDAVSKYSADPSCGLVATPAQPLPAVLVRDEFGEPFGGAVVTFSVHYGSSVIADSIRTTDYRGIARIGSWAPDGYGAHQIRATVSGAGIRGNPVTFTTYVNYRPATVINLSSPITLERTGVTPLPAILVKDQLGNPYPNTAVWWAVTRGESVVRGSSQTNAHGVAAVTEWRLISRGGHTITATVAAWDGCSIEGNPAWFTVTVP